MAEFVSCDPCRDGQNKIKPAVWFSDWSTENLCESCYQYFLKEYQEHYFKLGKSKNNAEAGDKLDKYLKKEKREGKGEM